MITIGGVVVLPEETVCTGHVDKALIALKDIDLGDCRLAFFVFLLRRNGIIPYTSVAQRELQIIPHVEADPFRIGALHQDFHGACCEALPVCPIFHEEIYTAVYAGGDTVTFCIGVVAEPVGIRR